MCLVSHSHSNSYVHIEIDETLLAQIDAISLRELVKNFPLVECLYLVWTEFVMDPLDVRIMSDWKRLNFLYHGGHEYLELHRLGGDENRFDPFLKSGAFDREKRLFPFF